MNPLPAHDLYPGEDVLPGEGPLPDPPVVNVGNPTVPPALVPQFDMPFRVVGGVPAVVEQDSKRDLENCVEVVCRTRPGQRIDDAEFGVDDPTFHQVSPADAERLVARVEELEPRAQMLADQQLDGLLETIRIKVGDNA